jgi:hypothetical protein
MAMKEKADGEIRIGMGVYHVNMKWALFSSEH